MVYIVSKFLSDLCIFSLSSFRPKLVLSPVNKHVLSDILVDTKEQINYRLHSTTNMEIWHNAHHTESSSINYFSGGVKPEE